MQKKLVIATIGKLIVIVGACMIIPLLTALIYRENDWWVFGICMPFTCISGFLMYKLCQSDERLRAKDGFAIVTYGWIIASLFGMLPYLMSGVLPHIADAFLETMSGFTTTGATVFDDIDHLPHSILIWRSLTHWLGGMGIIVLFVAILSTLGTGNIQMMKAEMTGPIAEKIRPRISDSAKYLWLIYIGLTLTNIVALMLCGFPLFDAINHAFAIISTGGFSTKTDSFGYYQNDAAEWVCIFFMFISGANFAIHYHIIKNKSLRPLWHSKVFRWYLWIVVIASGLITLSLTIAGRPFGEAMRTAFFHVVSVITTTGFITEDFSLWPSLAIMALVSLFFVGGCAGSTGGGVKVDRWVILFHQTVHELKKTLHPRLVTRLKVDTQPVSDNLIINVSCFFFLYMFIIGICMLIVAAFGFDPISSFSVVASCLGNVGPGFGVFGPVESLSIAPPVLKLLFAFLMLLGRLELFTVLAVMTPSFKRLTAAKEERKARHQKENTVRQR